MLRSPGLRSTNTLKVKNLIKEHAKNFIDSIKTGNRQACPPETGRIAALHLHIPNIAARTGESILIWDDASNRFTNSEAANKLITPVYRQPWTLPKF